MVVNICPELHSKIRERSQVSQSATEGQDLMLPVRLQVLESSGVALISVTGMINDTQVSGNQTIQPLSFAKKSLILAYLKEEMIFLHVPEGNNEPRLQIVSMLMLKKNQVT